jgi:hypothetical protein
MLNSIVVSSAPDSSRQPTAQLRGPGGCRSIDSVHRSALLLLLALPACSGAAAVAPAEPASTGGMPAVTAPAPGDPARIDGRWHYRTRTSCHSDEGVGEVTFSWHRPSGLYAEQGYLFWASTRQLFRWWGRERHLPSERALEGQLSNSLGDTVEARWQLAPGRLVLRWKQSNGCAGEGTATPREGLLASLKVGRLLRGLSSAVEAERVAAARALGEMGRGATSAIPQLFAAYQGAGGELAAATWEALEKIRR